MEVFFILLLVFVVYLYFSNTGGETKQYKKEAPPSNTNENSVNEKKATYQTAATKELKPVVAKTQTFKPEPLDSKKEAILHAVSNYTLTYEQVHGVWANKHRYSFSDDELEILRTYKDRLAPPVLVIIQTCRQCGMVGENCTCTRSWY